MVVIVLSSCPMKLRGDLTKWMQEIDTGVYVGNFSARVRDALWDRVCANLKDGHAVMVFSAKNEQHMEFRVHNARREIADFDGLKLVRRPDPLQASRAAEKKPMPMSKAAVREMNRKKNERAFRESVAGNYTVIDLETTGLTPGEDAVIELAALRVENGIPGETFGTLVKTTHPIPETITELTGIRTSDTEAEGMELKDALPAFLEFIGQSSVVCHNARFDLAFIDAACRELHLPQFRNRWEDTMKKAKLKLPDAPGYRLTELAGMFGIDTAGAHRASADCRITQALYEKLKEI